MAITKWRVLETTKVTYPNMHSQKNECHLLVHVQTLMEMCPCVETGSNGVGGSPTDYALLTASNKLKMHKSHGVTKRSMLDVHCFGFCYP